MAHHSKTVKRIAAAVLIVAGIGFLLPFFWLLLASFKGTREVYANPIGLPETWRFDNYRKALTKFDFPRYFLNSVLYTGLTVALVLFCVTLFTYATARMTFRRAGALQKYLQFGLVIPGGATLLGIYTLLLHTGLKNTYLGLILVYTASSIPVSAVILYGFFRSLPFSLEEAAALDGAGTFTTFFRVILPMVLPAISTVAVVTAMSVWNEYTIAAITIDRNARKSLPIGIQSFMSARGGEWGGMAAAMLLASLPTIILYLLYSEKLENALSVSAGGK